MDVDFGALISEHTAHHVHALGWHGVRNGNLLQFAADNRFEVIVTVDKNMPYQQNIAGRPFALIVLDTHPVNYANLAACVPALKIQLSAITPGGVYVIDGPHPKRR